MEIEEIFSFHAQTMFEQVHGRVELNLEVLGILCLEIGVVLALANEDPPNSVACSLGVFLKHEAEVPVLLTEVFWCTRLVEVSKEKEPIR